MIPNVLTIAGVDPSGGAGILADVKAFSALGTYGCAVITALTAQNTRTVSDIFPIAPTFIAEQINTLFSDVRIDALKIGMLGHSDIITTVADRLRHWKPEHIVLDPVMVAKSGDRLLQQEAINALRTQLIPLASVITPNLPEAGVLLDCRPAETVAEMRKMAEQLRQLQPDDDSRWVFLKGGHLPGDDVIDVLYNGSEMVELPGKRIPTKNTHGTGCTLAAALAALLPQKPDFITAAKQAKQYLLVAIQESGKLAVGEGHGPVHHFHQQW